MRLDTGAAPSAPATQRNDDLRDAERVALRRALRLARRGMGGTHPNPRVGAVVIGDGRTLGEGWHARAGGAHAERLALEAAGDRARNATLVVTLEPCAHHGRTPPCVDGILRAGIRRVVVGMIDPNPIVNGRGIAALREAGVEVLVGVDEDACAELNAPYLKALATGLPLITLKAMVSLDGRMATDAGDSRGLGGEAEQRLCHRLRAENDAVLVGIGTVRADDPRLTVRLVRGRTPWRVVLDSGLALADMPRAALFGTVDRAPVIVATVSQDAARVAALESRGARVWGFDAAEDGRVPLRPLLERLTAEGRYALLVEGGATVHTAFLRGRLADRLAIGIAPILVGGKEPRAWTGDLGLGRLDDAMIVEDLRARRVGRDLWLEGSLEPASGAPRV